MRRMRHLWQNDSGSVLVFVAVTIFALAAMAILAVDISKLLVTRAQLQNAADAGALAGAELFVTDEFSQPVSRETVEQRAREVAEMNRAFNDARGGDYPTSNVSMVIAVAETDETSAMFGAVSCTTRSVVSQYFTPITALMGGHADTPGTGNVMALAVARAGEVCKVQCLKPWSIPDRWDDTGRPGWPAWSGNKHWDSEKFTDQNGNGRYDVGEPFQDGVDGSKGGGPMDGLYTSEFYHSLLTGYIASKDLGELMRFKVANPHDASEPGQFYPIDLCQDPADRTCSGAANYSWNIANCNPNLYGPGDWVNTENGNMIGPTGQGLEELIAQDPGAQWGADCECITGSAFGAGKSPRIGFIPLHDPRIPLNSGKMAIQIVKIIAVFFEQVQGRDVMARFIRVQAPGEQCAPGQGGGNYVFNLSLIR